jgi:hypothetical protein
VFTAASLVPTPGGTGAAEGAFYFIYSGLFPAAVLPFLTVAWRFLTFYYLLLLDTLLLAFLKPGGTRVEADAA